MLCVVESLQEEYMFSGSSDASVTVRGGQLFNNHVDPQIFLASRDPREGLNHGSVSSPSVTVGVEPWQHAAHTDPAET